MHTLPKSEKSDAVGFCFVIVLSVLAIVYVVFCANHQTRLMNDRYGQKKDNPTIQHYH